MFSAVEVIRKIFLFTVRKIFEEGVDHVELGRESDYDAE